MSFCIYGFFALIPPASEELGCLGLDRAPVLGGVVQHREGVRHRDRILRDRRSAHPRRQMAGARQDPDPDGCGDHPSDSEGHSRGPGTRARWVLSVPPVRIAVVDGCARGICRCAAAWVRRRNSSATWVTCPCPRPPRVRGRRERRERGRTGAGGRASPSRGGGLSPVFSPDAGPCAR